MSNMIEIQAHVETYTDPYPGQSDTDKVFLGCTRCGGTGYTIFGHVDGGRCFDCHGTGGEHVTVASERKREKARVARVNAAERKTIKRQQFHNDQMEQAEAEFPILAGWHEAMEENAFLSDLWSKAFDYELSERQIAAAARTLQSIVDRKAERAAQQAELEPVVPGKQTVTGEIVSVKYQDSMYGGAWKILVREDRKFKVWGTLPASIINELEADGSIADLTTLVGRRIRLTATVTASDDDPTFGFYSRPTKASLLPQE